MMVIREFITLGVTGNTFVSEVHPHLFNMANQWGYVLQDSRYKSSPLMHDANVLPISQAYHSSMANSSFDATVLWRPTLK
jgi:hypothetical protein